MKWLLYGPNSNHPDLVMEEPTRRFHVAGKHMVNRQSGVVSPLLRRRRAPRRRHKVAVLLRPRVDGLTCRDLQVWQLKVVVLSSPAIALSSIIVFGILELVSVTIAFKIKVIIPPSAFRFTTNVFRNKLLSDSRTSLGSPACDHSRIKESPRHRKKRPVLLALCNRSWWLQKSGSSSRGWQRLFGGVNGFFYPFSLFLKSMCCSREVRKTYLSATSEHFHPLGYISKVKSILEVSRGVLSDLGDLHHLPQLLEVPSDEVEKRELVEVLGSLIAHLHHLVVALK